MSPISQRFPVPTNDDDFEKMCVQLLRKYWSRPRLDLFGKRGERQYGIDILDLSGETPIYAAQCKLKEPHKNLQPHEIQHEVDEAKKFKPLLGKYAILTSAKVSALAQRKVREINQKHKKEGLFELELLAWEQLCSLLQQYSEIQEQFYGEIALGRAASIEKMVLNIKDGVQSLTSKYDGDTIDQEINEARDCIVKREFQFATFLLNRIERNHSGKLAPRQRFRLLSNHGAAALGLNNPEVAARYFMEALQWQPDDEQAKTNEVLAYILVGDLASCHSVAERYLKQFPANPRLTALWVNSAARGVGARELEAQVNSVLMTDPEVRLSLARRAVADFDFETALRHATVASNTAVKWPEPQIVLAQIQLGKVLEASTENAAPRRPTLLNAEDWCSRAIELSAELRDKDAEKVALLLRSEIRLLLGNIEDAAEDVKSAERLDPKDIEVLLSTAQVALAQKRVDDALLILKKAYQMCKQPHVAFVYGGTLQQRGHPADLEEALGVLTAIAIKDLKPDLRVPTVIQVLRAFIQKGDLEGAEAYTETISPLVDPVVTSTCRGVIAHNRNQKEEAERLAVEALALRGPRIDVNTEQLMAHLLMLVGRPVDALPLLQHLFDRQTPIFNPRDLLQCSARLHRDDIVLQTCEELHKRGIEDWDLIEFESSFLEKYNVDLAIERLKEFAAKHPDQRLSKLRVSLIGIRLNKPELIAASPTDIPPVEELPVKYAAAAVQVIRFGRNPAEAVDYAYQFLRLHFNELEAHQALMISMMPGAFAPDISAAHERVVSGSAVCYQESPDENSTWVVIENTDSPNGDFEEISLSSPLAQELLGKRVGDTVLLVKGAMQNRQATVLAIMPKYVRRYQDSMQEMQVRFGAASFVESVKIDISEGDPRKGLGPILDAVEKRAAAVQEARRMYDSKPLSLHWFGSQFGQDAYDALIGLALEDHQQVKCCMGTLEERSEALLALGGAKAVTVDLTALATLKLLGLEQVLSTKKFQFVVSVGSLNTLREKLSKSKLLPAPAGNLQFRDGKHVYIKESDEERQRRIEKDEEFVRSIEKSIQQLPAVGLSGLQPENRELIEKFFGIYGAESIVLSSNPDYVLWTDDLVQAQFAAREFGARRVWTQLVLGTLTEAGLLTFEEYNKATALLICFEYVATSFDSSSLLAGVQLSDWSVQGKPASSFAELFADPRTDTQSILRIMVEFILRLYREPVAADTRCSISIAFLDAFSKKHNAMALLKSFRNQSAGLFGLNGVGREQFEKCFDRWLEQRDKPLITVP